MKLPANRSDELSLTQLGVEAARLIRDARYSELADRFGYALAYENDPSEVIKSEILVSLSQSEGCAGQLASADPIIRVKYFKPNDTKLFALVECWLAVTTGAGKILAELIITDMEDGKHVFLEQISYAA